MFVDSIVDRYVKDTSKVLFRDLPANKKAIEDFRYLANQSNFTVRDVNEFLRVNRTNDLGDFIVVGVDAKQSVAKFPLSLINTEADNQYVAFVIYNGEDVLDVYIISAKAFAAKSKLLPLAKGDVKKGEGSVKISKLDKLADYKWGIAIEKIINKKG